MFSRVRVTATDDKMSNGRYANGWEGVVVGLPKHSVGVDVRWTEEYAAQQKPLPNPHVPGDDPATDFLYYREFEVIDD